MPRTPRALQQHVPPLPANAPALLEPMLEHISVELGLDDLSLLDLRHLDPPPALGAGLLMILGTARSERHLHVSADRFCRWLRSQHQLTPTADGLLGRNELKLKLRRKARRARLLGSVGSIDTNADDGIRTGWVCVNVGTIDLAEVNPIADQDQVAPNYIGFGRRTEGVRVVVQMLTEEKREEMDLEGLWNGLARRHKSADGPASEAEDPETPSVLEASSEPQRSSSAVSGPTCQVRAFHTSLPRSRPDMIPYANSAPRDWLAELAPAGPLGITAAEVDELPSRITSLVNAGDYHSLRREMPALPQGVVSPDQSRALILRAHVQCLDTLSPGAATKALGRGEDDYGSTPFLLSFYQTIPPFPTVAHWEDRVALFTRALALRHPGYTKLGLRSLVQSMQLSGVDILPQTFLVVLQAILTRNGALNRPGEAGGSLRHVSRHDLDLAMGVIRDMSQTGHDVLTEDVFVLLHDAIGFHTPIDFPDQNPDDPRLDPGVRRRCVKRWYHQLIAEQHVRLDGLMNDLHIPIVQDRSLTRLMTLYANQSNWPRFWDVFSLPARSMRPRSAGLYTHMFALVARTQHLSLCTETLRTWVPQLDCEDPPVVLAGPLAHSVICCLRVVDAQADEEAQHRSRPEGEWARLWRRCELALENDAAELP
ncbi:MAG: ATPase synthesis protein 25 mitochondrial [Thelocarpon superellum]|nr:MAG: ATPase synthesis protein 25 mitochondrial [Thelocarpon superellum]